LKAKNLPSNRGENRANRKYISAISKVLNVPSEPGTYTYTERDSILYNLSLGAKRTDLPLVYENDDNFTVLPTIGVIPPYHTRPSYNMKELLPNFDPRKLVHGEQYFEVRKYPVPTSGSLKTTGQLLEVVDKGNAALLRRSATTIDARTGEDVFYGESVAFIRGAGGFGGAKQQVERGFITEAHEPPKSRSADKVVEEKTSEEQAALYRLMGDRNPLHIDPKFSSVGGFPDPILHGLCTMGVVAKHILQAYGPYKRLKVRFAGPVIPGQTIVTEMWKDGQRVVLRAKVKETGRPCITNAAVELIEGGNKARM
jgi:multifunctional beta-oxidation protein